MKRFFLFTLCLGALTACSDDETAEPAPVVGDVRFAAAIDPAAPASRVVQQGADTFWQAGDRIGITALIDGTPYIENVLYTLSDATAFSHLTPAGEAIRWNESVTGRRSFFACYPYDETNAEQQMHRAVVRFSVPAEQHVADGANTTEPVLLGEASTSAVQQQPVALRFSHFTPVLELRFEPLEQTRIATIDIAPAEGSDLTGWLTGEGTVDNLGSITLNKQSDRLQIVCDGEGFPLDEPRTLLIPLGHFTTGTGGLTLRAVTDDKRIFSETLFEGEPFSSFVTDEEGAFAAAKYIRHTMKMEVISDETTEVFFSDDFSWITDSERWDKLTGGGWPTVTAAGSPTGKANYFTLDLLDDFDRIGYATSQDYRTSVQARYEGYVCLGTSSKRAALTTPPLEKIGTEGADLLVSFHGACYASAGRIPDTQPLVISIDGPGTIGDTGQTQTEVTLTNSFRWRKYWIIVRGATAETRIVFGRDEALANARNLIDNVLVGRAVKGAVGGSRDVEAAAAPEIRLPEGRAAAVENLAGAETSLIVQATTSWTAACEADWLTVTPASEGLGTGIAYRLALRALTQNLSDKPRTATIIVTAGEATAELTVTQTHEIPEVVYFEDDFSWCDGDGTTGGIFDDKLTSTTKIGSKGTKYSAWTDAYKATGWTATLLKDSPTTRNGTLLAGGTTTAAGDVISPALTAIGTGPENIVVEYDVLEYKNAAETGKSRITIYAGGGKIVSIEGHYVPAGDDYTSLDPDGRTQYYYCGGYTNWAAGNARWHHIKVVIEGATSETQVQIAGVSDGYARFWLDNFRVTKKN